MILDAMRVSCLVFLLLLTCCRQVIDAVNMKQISPEIARCGSTPGAWYEYVPEHAPYFCLRTRHHILYHDPEMQLGYWRARHPLPPNRVVLEARGSSLMIHRSFVWDGMSFGKTEPRELLPTLLHDALYYARQGGAPVSRRAVDQAFLRACKAHECSGIYAVYLSVRMFGGLFGKPPGAQPPHIELCSPSASPAPLEPEHP